MSKLKLGVVFGGKSSEYGVSLHSAGSLLRQIDQDKYTVIMIGISLQGDWYLYEGDIDAIEHDHWQEGNCTPCVLTREGLLKLKDGTYEVVKVDCMFPVLHGKNGEDGTIQGLFEIMDIPYVGCGHMSSAICMDKEMTHIIAEHAGVPCAPYRCIYESDPRSLQEIYEEASQALGLPLFIKPCNAGSSYGVHCVENFEDFEEARALAAKAYRAMNCKGMTRVDMFVTPQHTIVFNELNTIPGFTATSRYPSMMKEIGIDFPELIDRLVALAMEK